MKPNIFDRLCMFLINPLVWTFAILFIIFVFKFWGCVFLLILFSFIKRANVQNP